MAEANASGNSTARAKRKTKSTAHGKEEEKALSSCKTPPAPSIVNSTLSEGKILRNQPMNAVQEIKEGT